MAPNIKIEWLACILTFGQKFGQFCHCESPPGAKQSPAKVQIAKLRSHANGAHS